MPNHVTNRVKFTGDIKKIQDILVAIQYDHQGRGSIDFNKIIPMPESLNITAGSVTDKGLKAYKDFVSILLFDGANKGMDLLNIPEEKEAIFLQHRTDIDKEEWDAGRQAFRNIQQYGFPTWYEWSINNWGTKWNAYDCLIFDDDEHDYDEICFNTAWSAPHPILSKIAQMYPDIEVEHEWADEDFGHNLGRVRYKGEVILEEYIPEKMKESYEFALKVHGYDDMETIGLSLNSTETDYIPIWHEDLSVVQFQDKVFLFSESRKSATDVPKGFYCYECRTSDDQSFLATLEPKVKVNFGGTLITDEPIDFGEKGYIDLKEEPLLFPDIDEVSFERFMNDKEDIEQEMVGAESCQLKQ